MDGFKGILTDKQTVILATALVTQNKNISVVREVYDFFESKIIEKKE